MKRHASFALILIALLACACDKGTSTTSKNAAPKATAAPAVVPFAQQATAVLQSGDVEKMANFRRTHALRIEKEDLVVSFDLGIRAHARAIAEKSLNVMEHAPADDLDVRIDAWKRYESAVSGLVGYLSDSAASPLTRAEEARLEHAYAAAIARQMARNLPHAMQDAGIPGLSPIGIPNSNFASMIDGWGGEQAARPRGIQIVKELDDAKLLRRDDLIGILSIGIRDADIEEAYARDENRRTYCDPYPRSLLAMLQKQYDDPGSAHGQKDCYSELTDGYNQNRLEEAVSGFKYLIDAFRLTNDELMKMGLKEDDVRFLRTTKHADGEYARYHKKNS